MYSIHKYNPIQKLDWYMISSDQDTAWLFQSTTQFSGYSIICTLACDYLICITIYSDFLIMSIMPNVTIGLWGNLIS